MTASLDCCPPVQLSDAHWTEHDARLQSARAAAEASRPRTCPRCAGDDLVPVFDVDGAIYSCEDCGHVFPGEEGR